jgi:hypothetical protein
VDNPSSGVGFSSEGLLEQPNNNDTMPASEIENLLSIVQV